MTTAMILFILLTLHGAAADGLAFSTVFGSKAVLQRGSKAAVYGVGIPGSRVTVSLTADDGSSAQEAVSATASATNGSWKVLLDPRPAGGSYTVTATDDTGASVNMTSVTFGDVFLCSGQSNMELGMKMTLSRNATYAAVRAGNLTNLRLFRLQHNPQAEPVWVTTDAGVVGTPWSTPLEAMDSPAAHLQEFSAACLYFGESLTNRFLAAGEDAISIGLVEVAFGGTMIESWVDSGIQLGCSNITCTANQSLAFDETTQDACFAAATEDPSEPEGLDSLEVQAELDADADGTVTADEERRATNLLSLGITGAGANGQLYNGMLGPFMNMTIKGWLWYQGENNLPFHAGNADGYACMLTTLVSSWRAAWSTVDGTTAADAPFGIVTLADSTDEGHGNNVQQMHWAQTANWGFAPNPSLPNVFLATAHDLPDPWDDGCALNAACCVDTGNSVDVSCGKNRDYLLQTSDYPGVNEPVTPSAGTTIHPRVKRQVGDRLATAAWHLVYGHEEVPFVGPVVSGCAIEEAATSSGSRQLRIRFNSTLLGAGSVSVSDYNREANASTMWVLVDQPVPADAERNYAYATGAQWWGDSESWQNVQIQLDHGDVVADLPAEGDVTAVLYGFQSPKKHPQNGHDKICCGALDFQLEPCPPESCPISSVSPGGGLPAMPFHARVVDGRCECFAPQDCSERV